VEHSSRSLKDDPPAWPAASFEDADWEDSASGPPNKGLRHGLRVAYGAMVDVGYVPAQNTDEGRLRFAIYLLSGMIEEGNTELSWLIAEARHKGVSWSDIAGALGGFTRQAAHRRFAPLIKERLKDVELGTAR
jgi:hypothetical protein